MIDTRRLFFDGNSQGGIMGGALTALAPDFDRAVLGVPGMNYSTLLQRSVDFDEFAPIIYGGYPNQLERQLWLAQIQLLWDRGESNGYAHHITSRPLPNTPKHTVLMHVAFGDHQVADFTAANMARTFGAARPPPGARRRPLGAEEPVVRAEDAEAAVHGLGHGLVGRRADAHGRHRDRGHARAADGERAAA